MGLAEDFEKIIELCKELEPDCYISARLQRRIANAYARAVEKALVIAWYNEDGNVSNERINQTIFRHAERGARDFLASGD
jgi:hypothetical protein